MNLKSAYKHVLRGLAPAALLLAFAAPHASVAQATATQDHVVSSHALDQQLTSNTEARQQNIETLQKMLDLPAAQKAMRDAKVSPEQVKSAIPTMSNDELANLSARVNKAQRDLSAGYIGTGLFTVIILVVVLIIIIIVIKA